MEYEVLGECGWGQLYWRKGDRIRAGGDVPEAVIAVLLKNKAVKPAGK